MLKTYFDGFVMRFSTKGYTPGRIDLDVGIEIRCNNTALLFMRAMNVMLKAGSAGRVNLGNGYHTCPLKVSMDDRIILSTSESDTRVNLVML